MKRRIRTEIEQEVDGRWLAEVHETPGAIAYGRTKGDAIRRAEELFRRLSSSTAGRPRELARPARK